jgi:general secretion pathway protein H
MAGRARPRTLPQCWNDNSTAAAGFTLLEIVCVLAIVALLASILLPAMPFGTSRPRLEAFAVEIATLLRADRNAAIRGGGPVAALVDAQRRLIRAGSTNRHVRLPDDVTVDALLPARCNGQSIASRILFFESGMSCGGVIRLTRPGTSIEVRVNWLTGGIDIVAPKTTA